MEKTWIVALGARKFFVLEADPLVEALEAYREGKVHQAARVLAEAEAYIAYTKDDRLLKAVEEAGWSDGRFLFRGDLDSVLNADPVAWADRAQLGVLLEGDPEEDEDLPISLRRLISDPSEFHANYARGHEVFTDYLHRDLLGRCSREVLEAFPGLENEPA